MPLPQYELHTSIARALSYAVAAACTGFLAVILALLIFYVPLWLTEGNGEILQLWPWVAVPIGFLAGAVGIIFVTPRLGFALAEFMTPLRLRRC